MRRKINNAQIRLTPANRLPVDIGMNTVFTEAFLTFYNLF